MKAIGAPCFRPVSEPSCLIEFDAPDPDLRPFDLLVRVRAVAVNPVDTKIRAALGPDLLASPRVLGWDAAGVVVASSSGWASGAPCTAPRN